MIDIASLPTGAAAVAAIVGQPVHHSLSPFLHNAWLRHMQINGVYAAFGPKDEHGFERLIVSCRSNGIKGLNITAPFKAQALALADTVADSARRCGSANVLTFDDDGYVHAQSTDGLGMVKAFQLQATACDLAAGPVVIMGAGGASRAAVAAVLDAGCHDVRIVNRTLARAEELVFAFQQPHGLHILATDRNLSLRTTVVTAYDLGDVDRAFEGAIAVINAASGGPLPPLDGLPAQAAVMDMTYRPLRTNWLKAAEARGLATVDGLQMLIEQARPSFQAFYGVLPDATLDIRALALEYLGEKA